MYKSAILDLLYEPFIVDIKDCIVCDMPTDNIGQRIKKLRISLGLTQEQFGSLIGHPFTTIAGWERGKIPTYNTQEKIISVFNLNKDFFKI